MVLLYGLTRFNDYGLLNMQGAKFAYHINYMLYSMIVPVFAHTIYDFLLFADYTLCFVLFAIFIVILYIYAFKIVKKVSNVNYNYSKSL